MPQFFKGDEKELKMYATCAPTMEAVSLALDEYFDGIYGCVPLGEFLWDEKRIPLTNAIKRDVFSRCFKQIFESWAFCGTFESYILVFNKIFGDDVEIDFTVPDPGKLLIDITSSGVQENQIITREIVDDAYVFHDLVNQDGDNVTSRTVLGIESESELRTILFFMVPNGIYTEITLTIGA